MEPHGFLRMPVKIQRVGFNPPAAQDRLPTGINRLTRILADTEWVDPRSIHMRPAALAQALADGKSRWRFYRSAQPSRRSPAIISPAYNARRKTSPFRTAQPPLSHATLIHRSVWVIPRAAPHADAAQTFAQWLSSSAGESAWLDAGGLPGSFPVRSAMVQSHPTLDILQEIQNEWSASAPASLGFSMAGLGERYCINRLLDKQICSAFSWIGRPSGNT